MRAVIGRARENRATVELEFMSSTSHEVCELWNGQGLVRTMGRPEVQQIIYLDEMRDDPETFGLYTMETAREDKKLQLEQRGKSASVVRLAGVTQDLFNAYCRLEGPIGGFISCLAGEGFGKRWESG